MLVELDAVAVRYGQRPSTVLSLADPALAWDLDFAVRRFGSWFESQREATKDVPLSAADKKAPPTKRVPKHTEAQLLAMLGIGDGEDAATVVGDPTAPRLRLADALTADTGAEV